MLVAMGGFVGGQFIVGALIVAVAAIFGVSPGSVLGYMAQHPWAQFGLLLANASAMAGLVYWFMRKAGIGLKDVGFDKPQIDHVFWALGIFAAYFVAYFTLLFMIGLLFPDLSLDQEQELGFDKIQDNANLLFVFVGLVILPPLAEEFVMRGFLYSGLRKSLNFFYSTIIVSAVFALAHLGGAVEGLLWLGALDTFILSVALCYSREKTGSLWPSIFAHGIKNGLAFSYLFLLPQVFG